MIDVTITVLIIGIVATVAAPKFATSLTEFRVESAARLVAADLRFARQYAKNGGLAQSVEFHTEADSYSLPGVSDLDHASEPFTVNLMKTGYPASLVSAHFGSGAGTVVFDIYGRPNQGGTVIVQVGDVQRTIVVESVSGRVRVQP